MTWIAVGVGGALGSMLRHFVSLELSHRVERTVPWTTFTVNVCGLANGAPLESCAAMVVAPSDPAGGIAKFAVATVCRICGVACFSDWSETDTYRGAENVKRYRMGDVSTSCATRPDAVTRPCAAGRYTSCSYLVISA